MTKTGPLPAVDTAKAKATIDKGRRANWWKRIGRGGPRSKYCHCDGGELSKASDLERIAALAIPPAWKFVRVNPATHGKIQAVGMDSAGRVQYIYDPAFAAKQQRKKFEKIERFGALLPGLRRKANEDIDLHGLPCAKVLAVAIKLIDKLYFRVGADGSARDFKTYGLTTLQKRHLSIGRKGRLRFEFVGKGHVQQQKVLIDHELAAVFNEMRSLGRGRKLFRFINDDGKPAAIKPAQINSYIKASLGAESSAKDFRTWGATVVAAAEFASIGKCEEPAEIKKNVVKVVRRVAAELGNTPSVCRSSYIHPAVIEAYESGLVIDESRSRRLRKSARSTNGLGPEEKALIRLLDRVHSV
ncbi:MAG: DNA topoisomerase IB [Acidobacteria bacterium]|nr:DNA topoisomerase IB [Acidobacteriota bacterium]